MSPGRPSFSNLPRFLRRSRRPVGSESAPSGRSNAVARRLTLGGALLVLLLGGCASVPPTPAVPYTGDPWIDGNANLAVAPAKDRVLWQYRLAATGLRRERWAETRAILDDALAQASANYGNVNSEAARSRRLFRRESDKPFIGEPYERIMAHFYRGILYWRDGEPDNARALFRTAQLLDSDTEDKTYSGDWVILDYLDGYASARLGGDGTDALRRARAAAKQQGRSPLPDYNRQANVFIFVEFGVGPRKYAGGEFGDRLKFYTDTSKAVSAELAVAGRILRLAPYDDLNYQATTRGGRVMDHILGNKAVFKQTSDTIGDVALVGAIGTAQYGRGEDANTAALGLAAVGLISKLASAATSPEADTRAWDNLPQYVSVGALQLEPGSYPATLSFYDKAGTVLPNRTQQFTLTVPEPTTTIGEAPPDVVLFKSEALQ